MTRAIAYTPYWIERGAFDGGDDPDAEPPDPWLDLAYALATRTPDDIADAMESLEDDRIAAEREAWRRAAHTLPQGDQPGRTR